MARQITENQAAIQGAARDYLHDHLDFVRLRKIIESEAGWDRELWRGFAVELGFAGLGISEEYGGSGLGAVEQSLVLEELGRTLAPIPYFETAVLAANLISATGSTAQKSSLLGAIASGELIATLAYRAADGGVLPGSLGLTLRPSAAGWILNGEAHYVAFGAAADLFLAVARSSKDGWDGLSLIAVPAQIAGVKVECRTCLDLTRPYSVVRFDDVALTSGALLGEPGSGGPALAHVLAAGAGLLAHEQLGGAARSLEETVAYAKDRVQFGRVIGSFQAVKHRLADMKLWVDTARNAANWAVEAIASGDDFEIPCAAARSHCTEAYLACAADAIQMHGGIGFTWEHHAHLFFKRARSSATFLDSPDICRERIAQSILDAPSIGTV